MERIKQRVMGVNIMQRSPLDLQILMGIPLTEFDNDRFALIEPSRLKDIGLPESCVILYYGQVLNKLIENNSLVEIHELKSVLTPTKIYRLDFDNKSVTVISPLSCGAPLAAVIMEELIALGCRKFVACGSAGSLNATLPHDSIVIPNAAVRDEGTSYHYLPPSRTLSTDPEVIKKLEAVLKVHGLVYRTGLNWTTDAPYRETRQKIAKRKAEGCLTVEMEFTALMAVARFRKVAFGEYLMVADDVSGEDWDSRSWGEDTPAKQKL